MPMPDWRYFALKESASFFPDIGNGRGEAFCEAVCALSGDRPAQGDRALEGRRSRATRFRCALLGHDRRVAIGFRLQ